MQAGKFTYEYSWLWENSDWADFTVDVLPAEAGPDTAALYSLKLQSVVLAAASPGHFRGYCTRLKGTGRGPSSAQAGEQRTPAAAVLRRASDTADQDTQSNATVDQAYAYRLTLFTGEPEGVPRAVLHHAYTGALPDDTEQLIRVSKNAQCTEGIWHRRDLKSDPEQLIWMLQRADYLDLADTVRGVLRKLNSVGSKHLTLQHAARLHSLPDLQCDTRRGETASQPTVVRAAPPHTGAPAVGGQVAAPAAGGAAPGQPAAAVAPANAADTSAQAAAPAPAPALAKTAPALLQELIGSLLHAHLPSAPAIVTDAALLAQFTQLPLALVKRWVELDKYEVDSGNTLAVLFTAWHDAQPEPPTEEQCKQLSDMLPLYAVSFGFHLQALQHLKWWRGGADMLTTHWLAQHRQIIREHPWRKNTAGASVAQRALPRAEHTWQIADEGIRKLWEEHGLDLPGVYLAGYCLGVRLTLKRSADDESGPLFLGLRQTVRWPAPLAAQAGLPVDPGELIHSNLDVPGMSTVWWDAWGLSRFVGTPGLTSLESLRALMSSWKLECELVLKGE